VSDSLGSLAEQHPLVSEALITISGNIRHTAVVLEVLVATKLGLASRPDPADASFTYFLPKRDCETSTTDSWRDSFRDDEEAKL
jgi:hypothetical protein